MYEATITRKMRSTRSEAYRNLLTRKNFKVKIEKMKAAKSSQKPTIIADLCEMFIALGIPCEKEQDAPYYAASDHTEIENIGMKLLSLFKEK